MAETLNELPFEMQNDIAIKFQHKIGAYNEQNEKRKREKNTQEPV